MKLKLYSTLFIAIALVALSCKTASKLYQKGNYDEAVELAAKKLQEDPRDPKLLDIIQNAYRLAVDDHENRIDNLAPGRDELKSEKIYYEYVSLQRMFDAIYRAPSVYQIVHPIDYSSQVLAYGEKAAGIRYKRGIEWMQHGDKQSYRQAYREFSVALQLMPGDTDAMEKKQEAFQYAVTNVVILPMQQEGGFVYSSYSVGGNNLDDQLIRDLQYNSGNEFVRFYSAWDARSQRIRVDQELELRLATLDIGRYHDNRSNKKVTKEIVVKEIVYKPDSVVRQYAKVNAEITTITRTLNSRAVLQLTVRDSNGRWIWSDNLPATYSWNTEFSTFTGDERALSDPDKQLVSRPKELAPSESEITRALLGEIGRGMSWRVQNYFSRY